MQTQQGTQTCVFLIPFPEACIQVGQDLMLSSLHEGLPWWLRGKVSACNAEDLGLIHGSGRSPGGGNGNPLQYPCLENSMDGGAC